MRKAEELRRAVRECQSRGLLASARWAAQQLSGLSEDELADGTGWGEESGSWGSEGVSGQSTAGAWRPEASDTDERGDPREADAFWLARTHFDAKEYLSAAYVLRDCSSDRCAFLRLYSVYLAGERRRREEDAELAGAAPVQRAVNRSLGEIRAALGSRVTDGSGRGRGPSGPGAGGSGGGSSGGGGEGEGEDEGGRGSSPAALWSPPPTRRPSFRPGADPFLLYLLGLVELDLGDKDAAREALEHSLTTFPANWQAWEALRGCYSSVAQARAAPGLGGDGPRERPIAPPAGAPRWPAGGARRHWAFGFFAASLAVDCHEAEEGLAELEALATSFPRSPALLRSAAAAQYSLQSLDASYALYSDLFEMDPHRVTDADALSNVLYVREDSAALGELARRLVTEAKFSPETAVVLGNHRSLRGEHARAVACFARALRLDPSFLAAWTLLGHEYVELKNAPAACAAYRAALDVNERDYRAWYGLGQAHELSGARARAAHSFKRAVHLRPHDARLWNALGNCLASPELARPDRAVECHERALRCGDREGVALHRLARLHEEAGRLDRAAACHRAVLSRMEADEAEGEDALRALSFLERYHAERGDRQLAEEYYTQLLDYGNPTNVAGRGGGPGDDTDAPPATPGATAEPSAPPVAADGRLLGTPDARDGAAPSGNPPRTSPRVTRDAVRFSPL